MWLFADKIPTKSADLARHILRRINEASGPYQMFYTLGDGMVRFQCKCYMIFDGQTISFAPDDERVSRLEILVSLHMKVLRPPAASGGRDWTLQYMEDIPIDYLNWKYAGQHRFMWLFGFDGTHLQPPIVQIAFD